MDNGYTPNPKSLDEEVICLCLFAIILLGFICSWMMNEEVEKLREEVIQVQHDFQRLVEKNAAAQHERQKQVP